MLKFGFLILLICILSTHRLQSTEMKGLLQNKITLAEIITNYLTGASVSGAYSPPQFYYYRKGERKMSLNEIEGLINENWTQNAPNFAFITHGFRTGTTVGHPQINDLKRALFEIENYDYIVIVDWSEWSQRDYFVIKKCLNVISEEIKNEVIQLNISLNNVEFFGHSLGAHVLGHSARLLAEDSINKEKIRRVTGMDPAGMWLSKDYKNVPAFELGPEVASSVITINTKNIWGANDPYMGTQHLTVPEDVLDAMFPVTKDLDQTGRHNFAWTETTNFIRRGADWENLEVVREPRTAVYDIIPESFLTIIKETVTTLVKINLQRFTCDDVKPLSRMCRFKSETFNSSSDVMVEPQVDMVQQTENIIKNK